MTFSRAQIEKVHMRVHNDAASPGAATAQPMVQEAMRQRVEVMNDVMATMLVYEKSTLDRDELDPQVTMLIDVMLGTAT